MVFRHPGRFCLSQCGVFAMSEGPDGHDRAIVGEEGVTYGLQIRTRPEASRAVVKNTAGVFGDDSSDSESEGEAVGRAAAIKGKGNAGNKGNAANLVVGKMIARQMAAMDKDDKVKKSHAEALRQDASVFDYDAHVDAIQEVRREKMAARQQEKVERKSKYIAGLLETAEHRKKEQEILFEKRLEKEREAEEAVYGTKEKFVTGAYRRKLEEEEKWKMEQEKKREEDEANAVEKRGNMAGFYANYLNVVGGGAAGGGNESGREVAPPATVDEGEHDAVKDVVGGGGAERVGVTKAATGGGDRRGAAGGDQAVDAVDAVDNVDAVMEQRSGPPVTKAKEATGVSVEKEEDPAARTAQLKREREEKIARAKARYAERSAAKRAK